jgi:hypothetical protein
MSIRHTASSEWQRVRLCPIIAVRYRARSRRLPSFRTSTRLRPAQRGRDCCFELYCSIHSRLRRDLPHQRSRLSGDRSSPSASIAFSFRGRGRFEGWRRLRPTISGVRHLLSPGGRLRLRAPVPGGAISPVLMNTSISSRWPWPAPASRRDDVSVPAPRSLLRRRIPKKPAAPVDLTAPRSSS